MSSSISTVAALYYVLNQSMIINSEELNITYISPCVCPCHYNHLGFFIFFFGRKFFFGFWFLSLLFLSSLVPFRILIASSPPHLLKLTHFELIRVVLPCFHLLSFYSLTR